MKRWFNSFVLLLLELLGAGLAAALVLATLLAWRLSEGPLRLHTLEPYVVAGLSELASPYTIKLSETSMTWGRDRTSLGLRASDVRIFAPDGRQLATVPEVEIDLSVPALLLGRPAPKLVRLIGPDVRVVRTSQGNLQLSLAGASSAPAAASGPDEDLLQRWLDTLTDEPKASSLVGALRAVEIEQARLMVDDYQYHVRWQAPRADLQFARDSDGMRGTLSLDIATGRQLTKVTGRLLFDRANGELKARLGITDFNPASLANWAPAFRDLARVDVPLQGHLVMRWLRVQGLAQAEFDLAAGKGNVHWLADQPALPLSYAKLTGRIDRQARTAEISDLYLDFGGPTIRLMAGATREGDDVKLLADATIEGMPANKLKQYWPPFVARGAHKWVTENITSGQVPKASAQARLRVPLANPAHPHVDAITGSMQLKDITVNYLRPLPPVTKAQGYASFDQSSFNITVESGELVQPGTNAIKLTGATINLSGFTDNTDRADIELTTSGTLASQLQLLDHDRLGYPRRLGLKSAEAKGQAEVTARFQFPLVKDLLMDQVAVSAGAKMRQVALPRLVAGQDMTDGQLELKLDGGGMTITGTSKIGPAPVQMEWTETFVDDVSPSSEIRFTGSMDEAARQAFNVSWPEVVADAVDVAGYYSKERGKSATLDVQMDFSKATLALPWFGWHKPVGEKASGSARVTIGKQQVEAIPAFSLDGAGAKVIGKVSFAAGSRWQKVTLDRLNVPGSDLRGDITNRGEAGLALSLKGPLADIRSIFDEAKTATAPLAPPAAAASVVPPPLLPLEISFDIKKVVTGPDHFLLANKGRLARNDRGWTLLDITGRLNGKTPMQLQLLPSAKGRSMNISSEDAGLMLSTLRLMPNIQGGRLVVAGDGVGREPVTATLELTNFRYLNAKTLQKIASAAAPEGAEKLAQEQGIAFKRLKAKYEYAEDLVRVRDAKLSGDTLGLSMAGKIDLRAGQLDLSGTVVPLYGINSAVSGIPILGWILTGGEGGGVFAATYSLKGPLKDPQTSVNPLSVLAPGFLRELFFVDSR